LKNEKEKQRNR